MEQVKKWYKLEEWVESKKIFRNLNWQDQIGAVKWKEWWQWVAGWVGALQPVRPDLAKFRYLGKNFKDPGNLWRSYLVLGKILHVLWQIFSAIRESSIVVNDQNWKHNLGIWSHCLRPPRRSPFFFFLIMQNVDSSKSPTRDRSSDVWVVPDKGPNQCDHVCRFFKFLGEKLWNKSSPNVWGRVGLFLKTPLLKQKLLWVFLGKFL